MALHHQRIVSHVIQLNVSLAKPGLLDSLLSVLRDQYATDFYLADAGYNSGRMEETTKDREKYWARWIAYVAPLGMDPYLQKTTFMHRTRLLSGFAARVRSGAYGR